MALPKVDETVYKNAVALAEQRADRIEALEAALREIIKVEKYATGNQIDLSVVKIARAALDKDTSK